MASILTVEDCSDSYSLIKRALGSYHLEWARSLADAKKAIDRYRFDLILLDVSLPDGDGYTLCSMLQTDDQIKPIPVIFLTARNSVSDKILGFSVGASDFVTKPFDPFELKARVDAKLRRREMERVQADLIQLGEIRINKSSQKVLVDTEDGARELELSPTEFKLLVLLSREPNRIFTRDEILNSIWGENIHVYGRSVDTHISKLRKKLGKKASYITSAHGTGYSFSLPDEASMPRLDEALMRPNEHTSSASMLSHFAEPLPRF